MWSSLYVSPHIIVVVIQRGFDFVVARCSDSSVCAMLVARSMNRDLSEKENSKFESAIILNFDQKSESEFLFREIGIGIRNRTIILKINSRDSRNSDAQ